MEETIFDAIERDIPEGKEGFFELAKQSRAPKDDSWYNSLKEYGKTILKGTAEGLNKLGNVMGPLQTGIPKQRQEEKFTESLEELLPGEEGFVQKGLRRGLKEAPTVIAQPFGAGALQSGTRSILAGFAGEGAKELGLPEWAQAAAELTAFVGPDITKKLLSSGTNKELIEFAKKMGMTDAQITPLIQSDFKQKWLSKLSPKRGSTETALQETRKGIGNIYEGLQNSKAALGEITEQANGKLINGIRKQMAELPRELQDKVEKDIADLLANKITGKSLINLWKDLNSYYGQGKEKIGLLKEPLKEALHSISPNLAKDFDMTNQLYTKYFPIASKLKPNMSSDILSAGEALTAAGAVFSALTQGNFTPMAAIIGEQAVKRLSQQMLLNPHLQQLSKKIVTSVNENKFTITKKLVDSFALQIEKNSLEAAKSLRKLSLEEIEEMFSSQSPKSSKQRLELLQ